MLLDPRPTVLGRVCGSLGVSPHQSLSVTDLALERFATLGHARAFLFPIYKLNSDAIRESSSDQARSGRLANQRQSKLELLRNGIHIIDYEGGNDSHRRG